MPPIHCKSMSNHFQEKPAVVNMHDKAGTKIIRLLIINLCIFSDHFSCKVF